MRREREHPTNGMRRDFRDVFCVGVAWVLRCSPLPTRNFAQDPPPSAAGQARGSRGQTEVRPRQMRTTRRRMRRISRHGIRCARKKTCRWASITCTKAIWTPPSTALKTPHLPSPATQFPSGTWAKRKRKKGMKKQAIKSYKRYLDLYPKAEDKDKIQKKIDKLYKDVEKEKKS